MKHWEIIADNLSKAGWSWGCVSAIDSNGRTIWIADAHRGDGKRFVAHADEKLTAFLESGSGPSGGTPRGDFSRRGQPAARLNRRAATPNAIRVSVINDRVDPVSGYGRPDLPNPRLVCDDARSLFPAQSYVEDLRVGSSAVDNKLVLPPMWEAIWPNCDLGCGPGYEENRSNW